MSDTSKDAGGSILPLATRDHPVDWHSLVRDALAPLDLSLSPSVESTLDALTTYAASGPSDPTSFVALLLSLHAATRQWPFAVRAALRPPPVRVGVGGASVAVSGAAMEAFVVLYNAAVGHFDAGVTAMSRVRADDTATARAGRGTNGKAAYKSFGEASRLAAQANAFITTAAAAASGSGEGDGPMALAPADCCVVQQHFDLRALRELTELLRAVAKYVYSTASGAVSTRHSALARLAHCAALLPLPPGAFAESLRQLPTVLLAACHKHRAQFFYQELSNRSATPEMERVLGHIAYAYRLLDDMQREATATAAAAATAARAQRSSGGGWGILGRLSATLTGRVNSGGDNEDDNKNNNKNDNKADDTCEPFARLATLFAGSHLMRVFPLLPSLARDVAQLSAKYAHENESVYMVRAVREHDVAADVPDADPIAADVAAPSIPFFSFSSFSSSSSSGSSGPFGELPAAAEVRDRAGRAERAAGLRSAAAQLRAVLDAPLPARCLAAAQRIAPLLRGLHSHNNSHNNSHNDNNNNNNDPHPSPCGPVDIAGAVRSAFSDAEAAVARHEAVSAGLRHVKSAYIGNHVGSAAETVALRRRLTALSPMASSAAAAAEAAMPHAADCDALHDALLPNGLMLRGALRGALRAALEQSKGDDGESEAAEARAALRLAEDAIADGHWDRVAQSLDAAADALEEAIGLRAAADEATAQSERERARVVVTPLRRVAGAQFGAKAAAAQSGRRRRRSEERQSTLRHARRRSSESNESNESNEDNKSSGSSESDESSESREEAERRTRRGRGGGGVRGVKEQPRRAVQRRGSSSSGNKNKNKDKDREEKEKEKEKEKRGKVEVGATVATVSKSLLRRLREQQSPSDESSATEEEREEVKEAKRRKPAPRRRRGS